MRLLLLCGLLINGLWLTSDAEAEPPLPDLSKPARIAEGVSGHVHPSICLTKNSNLLVIYSKSDNADNQLMLGRSSDGGRTWSKATTVPHVANITVHPGSLTTLQDGRILHVWGCFGPNRDRKLVHPAEAYPMSDWAKNEFLFSVPH